MKVSRRWIQWAHGPGAEDGQSLACELVQLAQSARRPIRLTITEPHLIAELISVAELYCPAGRHDVLREMGPWWMGEAARIIREGRLALKTEMVTE